MIYPEHFEEKIGFVRIREMLKKRCLSTIGRDKVTELSFSSNFALISQWLDQTAEMQRLLDETDSFPTENFLDLREQLEKAAIVGSFLTETELFDLRRSLDTINRIIQIFSQRDEEQYPQLRALVADAVQHADLLRAIDRILDKFGKVKDNASHELHQIRRELFSKQSGISRRINLILQKAQQDGWVDTDSSVTIRDGKMLIPVPATHKRRIKGVVYDESATGKTVFIEPVEIIELNNEVRELEFAERREVIKILREITELIRPHIPKLELSYELLGEIDLIRAKVLLATDFEAIRPRVRPQPEIDWHAAVHPLLAANLRREHKTAVPLSIRLDATDRILVISGPNAGGKSVCLKTVGLLQYMMQCGLAVPMLDSSTMGIFENLFIDIGDEQSLDNDLSTYSSHLTHMKFFSKNATPQSLFLIDEFGTGTEPLLGGAIAEAILERLNELQAFGVVNTHYTNLKHFASNTPGIVNGAMQYDTENLRPLFILKMGKPGSSFAFEIARSIGLSHQILERATQKVGVEHINYDKNLKDLEREKQKLENKQRKINRRQRDLDELVLKYSADRDALMNERREMLKASKQQAKELLDNINRRIENTIHDIRKAEAEKTQTKQLRTELDEFKNTELEKLQSEEEKIQREMEKIRRRAEKSKQKLENSGVQTPTEKPKAEAKPRPIAVGDLVRLQGQKQTSEVLAIDGKDVTISLGQLKTTVKLNRLERLSDNEMRQIRKQHKPTSSNADWQIETSIDFRTNIDLRGRRADEALIILRDYIDDAIVAQVERVRILHGKGNGILRKLIRDYLGTVSYVSRYADEHIDMGGDGITIVEFRY